MPANSIIEITKFVEGKSQPLQIAEQLIFNFYGLDKNRYHDKPILLFNGEEHQQKHQSSAASLGYAQG